MKSLYSYISQPELIDGHIHLFDHSGSILDNDSYKNIYKKINKLVCFMDIDFENLDKYNLNDTINYYDMFIANYYDPNKMILLATGTDSKSMIETYKKHPDIIKGFGELKCYSYYKKSDLNFGNLKWFEDLCEFNKDLCLPIFIHWYVYDNKRFNELNDLISKYPNIPFVLCHFGVSPKRNFEKQYEYVKSLLLMHKNLYVDVSYKVIDDFLKKPELIKIFNSRFLLGTDINIKSTIYNNNNDIFEKYVNLYRTLNLDSKNTLSKIFNNT
jgi:hypothetical protein